MRVRQECDASVLCIALSLVRHGANLGRKTPCGKAEADAEGEKAPLWVIRVLTVFTRISRELVFFPAPGAKTRLDALGRDPAAGECSTEA